MCLALCRVGVNSKYLSLHQEILGFPGGSAVKNLLANSGDMGSIAGSGVSPGEGNGNLLQYSCLENHMDRGAWQVTAHWVSKSQTELND